MSDKLMELFDLATEQYTPLPGKQAKTLSKILYNQKDLKKASSYTIIKTAFEFGAHSHRNHEIERKA